MDQGVTQEWLDRIERRVAEAERGSKAEVVVVIAERSGSYRDLALLVGAGCAAVALLALLYLPLDFPSATVLPLTAIVGALGTLGARRCPGLLRRLALSERRKVQVASRAREVFFDEAVSGTRERTGVLVFASRLEDEVLVLTDHGVDAKIPAGRWHTLVAEARRGEAGWEAATEALLVAAAALLAECLPADEDDNPDEIPNRPRVIR